MSIQESSPRARIRRLVLATLALFALLGVTLASAPSADAQHMDGRRACIESAEVQNEAAAKGLGMSASFVAADGTQYVITAGPAACNLDASTCDPTLNLYMVDDVAKCLAANAAAAPAPMAAAGGDAGPAAPAASSGSGGLAHTGEEHVLLGAAGTALLGAGFAALGLGRRGRRRDS